MVVISVMHVSPLVEVWRSVLSALSASKGSKGGRGGVSGVGTVTGEC